MGNLPARKNNYIVKLISYCPNKELWEDVSKLNFSEDAKLVESKDNVFYGSINA